MKAKRNYIITIIFVLLCVIFFVTILGTKNQEGFESYNYSSKSMELVVARYNESLNWLDKEPYNKYPTVVYNKGTNDEFNLANNITKTVPLKNVGRCDHTYLYHVIENYNNLADITVFLPGSCDIEFKDQIAKKTISECENTNNSFFLRETDNIYEMFKDFKLDEWIATHQSNKNINDESKLTLSKLRPYGKWYKHHFGEKVATKYVFGGIFAVHKRHILQHPVEYYQELIKELEVSSNPEVGHYFERAWGAVFGPID